MNLLPSDHPITVIGAGPAGVSCAVWLRRLGLPVLLLEADDAAGGLCRANPWPDGWNVAAPFASGHSTAAALQQALAQVQVPVCFETHVDGLHATAQGFQLDYHHSSGVSGSLNSTYVVLASGVRPRPLPEALGQDYPHIWVGPGQHLLQQDVRGLRVAVLGGGDNAFENSVQLRERGAAQVDVYARHVRAQAQWVARVPASALSVGAYTVQAASAQVNQQQYDALAVFYGWQARLPEHGPLPLNPRGFVAVDAHSTETPLRNLFAIGEVAQRQHPCVVTAMADGVVAAKAIQARWHHGQP